MLFLAAGICLATTCSAQNSYKVRECVVENGVLKEIVADYNAETGDKTIMVNGVKRILDSVQSKNKEYAYTADWYKKSEMIVIGATKYEKYGLPRILGTTEVVKSSVYKGIPVFQETGLTGVADVIYIPVRWGCEFQPYQRKLPECGKVKIKATADTIAIGKSVGLQIESPKADPKYSYSWRITGANVRGPENQSKIALTHVGQAQFIFADVIISAPDCWSAASKTIEVRK